MAKRNGFSELAKLLVRYPTQGQREKLKQLLLQNTRKKISLTT